MEALRKNWPMLAYAGGLAISAIVFAVTLRTDVDHAQDMRRTEMQFVQAEIVGVKKKQSDQTTERRKLDKRLRGVETGITDLKAKADAAKEQRDRMERLLRRAVNGRRR